MALCVTVTDASNDYKRVDYYSGEAEIKLLKLSICRTKNLCTYSIYAHLHCFIIYPIIPFDSIGG